MADCSLKLIEAGHDLSVVTIKANKAAPAEDEEASDAAE